MARAVAKFIRMSPRKMRRVINEIRGKDTIHAQTILKFMPYAAARVVEKVLKSAVSNAKENENLNPDELRVSKAYVDQSATLRRWRAMSRGRGFPILKRTSHVTVEVEPDSSLAGRKIPKVEKKIQHKHEHKHGAGHEHKHEHEEEKKQDIKGKKQERVKEKTKKPKKKKGEEE